ncbi:GH32 C-terminal domain-containing protein [Arthrobacter sp. 2RAF6]|uniref:GH32 C-terminal domain-containing protein n=1 Tax=Arthrobacter sp. 2RAF6 TaxID=3233002 RepID=UPI003F8E6983
MAGKSRFRSRRGKAVLAAALAAGLFLPLSTSTAVADTSYTETYRPQFHYSPARNWMNDPNGLVYYNGQYHLFYQYNPSGTTWGNMSWGHAVSTDLIHWSELPVAIPQDDADMIFSGSVVVDTNNTTGLGTTGNPAMVAIYTAANKTSGNQSQALAYSTDGGQTFTKYSGNPVLDIGSNNFRDPKVFWYAPGNEWLMTAALSDQQKVTFYSSPDLKQWTHLSDFGPAGATGGPWECPDLFPLPDPSDPTKQKWVLIVNLNPGGVAGGSGSQYFTGNFDGTWFTPDGLPTAGTPLGGFDAGNYDGWTAAGTAFGSAPVTGTLPGQMPVSGWTGAGYANSFNGGDAPTGTLSSPDFTINHGYLNFLVGGGNHPFVPGSVVGNGVPDGTTFADFEGTTYGTGWQAAGDFANTGPAQGTLANQNPVSGYIGSQLVNTFTNGDAPTGTITSPSFTLSQRFVNLQVGGGNHPWGSANPTAVNLVVDGQVVDTATGQDSEHLGWVSWDLNAYQGRTATIQIVDQNSGGWGHILADQIMLGDNPVSVAQDTSARLVVDGHVVRSATGQDSEHLDWTTWDLSDLQGKTGHIEIDDNNANTYGGSWAHILADQFSLSDTSVPAVLQRQHWVDFGKDDYAAVTYNDAPDGKRIMLGWMNNWDYGQSIPTSPWRSAMTVPKELSLSLVGGVPTLIQKPVDQLTQLHNGQTVSQQNVPIPAGTTGLAASGEALDITATFSPGTASSYGIKVRTGSGQETLIGYDNAAGQVYIDRTNSGNSSFASSFPGVQQAPLAPINGMLKLHVLVDWSSVEVFANDGQAVLTDQILPDPTSQGVAAFANGGTANLVSLTVNQMGSAW